MTTPPKRRAWVVPRSLEIYKEFNMAVKKSDPDDMCCLFCLKSCASRSSCAGRYMIMQGSILKSKTIELIGVCDMCMDKYKDDGLDNAELRLYPNHHKPFLVDHMYRSD